MTTTIRYVGDLRIPSKGSQTPWGPAEIVERMHEGVYFVSTASHGGAWVSPERLVELRAKHPELLAPTNFYPLDIAGQWFEEDVEISRVVLGLDCFTPDEKARALVYLRGCHEHIAAAFVRAGGAV